MSDELSGKVAIVTGGASGIGRATVAALLGAGATGAALDRDDGAAGAVVGQGVRSGGTTFAVHAVPGDTNRTPDLVPAVLARCARIDILVKSRGFAGRGQTLVESDQQEWALAHSVNLKPPPLL